MKSTEYLKWFRKQEFPCIITMQGAVPHHIVPVGMGRNKKLDLPEHWMLVPLSNEYHTQGNKSVHKLGIEKFQLRHDVNLYEEGYKFLVKYLEDK